jgi:hypothetical protein
MFRTLYPVNPQRKVVNGNAGGDTESTAFIQAASSQHPGSASIAKVDGSVRFVKEEIALSARHQWMIRDLNPRRPYF